jgi:hypothetical protein
VTVIRGSRASIVDGRDGFVREARRVIAPTASRWHGSDPSPPAAVDPTPQVVVVFVDARDDPETAWAFVSPWEGRGIEVHGGREPSIIVIHSGPSPRVSRIRLHGATGKTANPSVIRTLGPGGDGSNIKVHSMRSRQRSRIRVHGGSRSSR